MGDADWLDLEFLADDDRRCPGCKALLGTDMVTGVGVEARLFECKVGANAFQVEGPQAFIVARCPDCSTNLVFDSVMNKERLLKAVARVWDELDEQARTQAAAGGLTEEVIQQRLGRAREWLRSVTELLRRQQ